MNKTRSPIDKNIETAVHELLDSRAESRIYVYLLRKNRARSDEIIRGTKLHPSTVRELLSKMYDNKIIYQGKNQNRNHWEKPILIRCCFSYYFATTSSENHRITT